MAESKFSPLNLLGHFCSMSCLIFVFFCNDGTTIGVRSELSSFRSFHYLEDPVPSFGLSSIIFKINRSF